jgi:hypothetical protein
MDRLGFIMLPLKDRQIDIQLLNSVDFVRQIRQLERYKVEYCQNQVRNAAAKMQLRSVREKDKRQFTRLFGRGESNPVFGFISTPKGCRRRSTLRPSYAVRSDLRYPGTSSCPPANKKCRLNWLFGRGE